MAFCNFLPLLCVESIAISHGMACARKSQHEKILIAGIGNIFHGDDGFGCETVRELTHRTFPDE